LGLNPETFGVLATPDGRFAFLDPILWPADRLRRICLSDLADDKKIKEHPHRSGLLLYCRFGMTQSKS
jgi:hypothetical protein